eukprot:CAMPEP_0181075950 /NCGR_PEP_ID=MMETSP1071-20121207/157_1 /TAXON_ID=35127 /ORGANISM="Thalassiosira sp., Strain NH16" /LENGTH=429 /DNA_ID=CAMNT_0023157095 /DNA_START=53 /DNA_END=1342 /DNA_ORIENTATION=+
MPSPASTSLLNYSTSPLTVAIAATAAAAITSSIVSSLSMRDRDRSRVAAEKRCQELEEELSTLRLQLKQAAVNNNERTKNDNEATLPLSSLPEPPPGPGPARIKKLPTIEDETAANNGGLFVTPVGTIRSIYKLCVGTPRQGLLAPNARGCIELAKIGDSSASSSVIGLEGYSHVWIIFVFHLNTKSSNPNKRIKSKISPPALGGEKVGIFATRSPHRYNPIGITLCKIDRIERIKKTRHTKERVLIHLSGLDLVDGTPVLDIKPYVPTYDSVSPADGGVVNLPSWVEGGLATKRRVIIAPSAKTDLTSILENDSNALQFYGSEYGEHTVDETAEYALGCIRQVLAIDVRSNYQTKKARGGNFQAERARRLQGATQGSVVAEDVCTQQLDNLLIEYTVDEASDRKRASSAGSGAEDEVTVSSIKLLEEV